VSGDERFEIVAPHPLNLLCLRLAGDDDRPTDELIEQVNSAGRSHVTRTVLDGRSVLRVSVGARRTERRHVEALWRELTDGNPD
jgi:aromatic-L-amino-acid decarboxylase